MCAIQVVELRAVRHAEVHVEGAQELEIKALKFERKVGSTVYFELVKIKGFVGRGLGLEAVLM